MITKLAERVGWKQTPASFPLVLSEANLTSESGRYFQDYSWLVTLPNILALMENDDAGDNEAELFNDYLIDLRRASINDIVSAILREGSNLKLEMAYAIFNETIENTPEIFDEVIGLQVACSVIALMQHTTRSNFIERFGKESSAVIYRELNDVYTANGVLVSTGLKNRIQSELVRLRNIIFPKKKPFIATPCFT